jgi:putative hydrolase of the HAD superfamily
MGELCGRTGPEIRHLLIDSGLQWDFERGRLTPEEFHRRFEECVGQPLDREALRRAGSDIFDLNPAMPPLLEALAQAGVRLVLLSNTSASHFKFVKETFDILEHFDDFVLSFEVGAIKPAPEIFEAALQKIECAPGECLYTDDIAEYVEAARGYSIDAEVFTGADDFAEHLRRRGFECGD